MKKKGFTLIELLAVLVVLAILALITIPLVIGIIKNARVKSHQRSIVNYGRTVETAVGVYLLDHDITLPSNISLNDLKIHTSGEEVICDDIVNIKADGKISLTNCYVSGTDEKYNYENRKLTKVSTNDTSTNPSTTYNAYSVGDTFTLNGDSYHIIENSGTSQDYVVALKDTPLTVSELNTYGSGRLNEYSLTSQGTAHDIFDDGSVGAMAYYTSKKCGVINGYRVEDECITNYDQSDVRYALDAWATARFNDNELKEVNGYSTRLIQTSELSELGYEWFDNGSLAFWKVTENTPSWIHNNGYYFWTMSQYGDHSHQVYNINGDSGSLTGIDVYYNNLNGTFIAVRPVINVYKDKLPE